jgi:hypothetical protein
MVEDRIRVFSYSKKLVLFISPEAWLSILFEGNLLEGDMFGRRKVYHKPDSGFVWLHQGK